MWPRFFGALVAGRQGHKNDCKKYWLQYISENTWFQRKHIEFHLFKREKNQCKICKNNCTFFQILGHSEGADFLLRQRTHSPAIGTFLPYLWCLGCLHASNGPSTTLQKRGDDLHILQLAKISLLTSWSSSSYNSHMKLGRWRVHTARVCPHLSSPVCDEGGARAKANTKVHSKPAITWVLSLVCPPKCQAHIEHRYTYIYPKYILHIYMGSFAVRVAILLHSSVQQISVLCVVETTLKDLQFWSNIYECTRAIQISSTMIVKTHLINMLCNFYW